MHLPPRHRVPRRRLVPGATRYPTSNSVTKLLALSLSARRLHLVQRAAFPVRRTRLAPIRAIAYFMALCSLALEATPTAAQAIVPNGYFTNVYVYQKSFPAETWDQHLAAANAREPGLRPPAPCPLPGLSSFDAFSQKCIDAFTRELMRPTWPSYFDPLAEYTTSVWPFGFDTKYIHAPLFFGSGAALQRCVQDALDASHHEGVLQWKTITTLANCHDSGMDPSPQVNLIFSPDIKVANFNGNRTSDGPEMCSAPQGAATHSTADHLWGVSVPNMAVLPTRSACASGFDDFTVNLTHEVVEILSDPGGAGYGSPGNFEIGDLCENEDQTTQVSESWKGLLVTGAAPTKILQLSRYCVTDNLPANAVILSGNPSCKAFSGSCQPRLDPPAGSVAQTWVLGQGEPLFEFTGHAHTLTLGMPASRVTTDALLTQAGTLLVVQTGGDDLRGGSHPGDNADVTLGFSDGSQVATTNVNQGARWADHTTHSVTLNTPPGAKASDITSVTISTNFGGGLGGDNWKVDSVALVVSYSSGSVTSGPIPPPPVVHDWMIRSELPLIRFSQDIHDLVLQSAPDDLQAQDLGQVVSGLNLIISTGNDDLRGGSNPGDNCDVTIQLTSGPPIVLKNVNGGQKWDNWTNHTVSVPLPAAGLHGGDVVSVTLHTGFSGGLFGWGADNWNVEQVILEATLAPPACDGCAIASAIAASCIADDPKRAGFDPTHGTVGFAQGASGHIKLTCPVRAALSSPTSLNPSAQRQLSMTFYNDNAVTGVIRRIKHCSITADFLRSNLDNTEAGADIAMLATANQPFSGRQTLSMPVGQLDFSTSYYWVDVDLFRDSPVAACNPILVGVFLK